MVSMALYIFTSAGNLHNLEQVITLGWSDQMVTHNSTLCLSSLCFAGTNFTPWYGGASLWFKETCLASPLSGGSNGNWTLATHTEAMLPNHYTTLAHSCTPTPWYWSYFLHPIPPTEQWKTGSILQIPKTSFEETVWEEPEKLRPIPQPKYSQVMT